MSSLKTLPPHGFEKRSQQITRLRTFSHSTDVRSTDSHSAICGSSSSFSLGDRIKGGDEPDAIKSPLEDFLLYLLLSEAEQCLSWIP
jgi:hypothetical protein